MSAPVLHVRGQVLVGREATRDEVWVIDGKVSFTPPQSGRDVQTVDGWVLPGLVDAHCHVGLDPHGACAKCGAKLAGHFDAKPGKWGARRMPIAI